MTEGYRRVTDDMIAGFDKRLALIEQAQTLTAKAQELHSVSLEKSIAAVALKVDTVLAGVGDIQATPAGRFVARTLDIHEGRLEAQDGRLDAHQGFIDSFAGSVRALKGLIAVLAAVTGLLAVVTFFSQVPTTRAAVAPSIGEHIHATIEDHPVDGFVIPRAPRTYRITVAAHDTTGPVTWFRLCTSASCSSANRINFDGQSGRPAKLGPCADCSVTFSMTVDYSTWSAGRWEHRWSANIASNSVGQRQFNTSRSQVCVGSCTNRSGRATPYNGGGSWYLDHYATVLDLSPDTAHRPGGSIVVRAAQNATAACAFLGSNFHADDAGTRLGCWTGQSNRTIAIPGAAAPGDKLVLYASEANGNAGLIVQRLGNGSPRATTTYEYQSWWAAGGIVLP